MIHERYIREEVIGRGKFCAATWIDKNMEDTHVCYLTPNHAVTSTTPDPEEHLCECGFRWTHNGHTAAFNRIMKRHGYDPK